VYTRLDSFTQKLTVSEASSINSNHYDVRFCTALVLYRLIMADGKIRGEELKCFRNFLENELSVSEDELINFEDMVARSAVEDEKMFEESIKSLRKLPEPDKRNVMRLLAELSISDGKMHETELAFMHELEILLGLSRMVS